MERIVFGADPVDLGVGVDVTFSVCTISYECGWIHTKFFYGYIIGIYQRTDSILMILTYVLRSQPLKKKKKKKKKNENSRFVGAGGRVGGHLFLPVTSPKCRLLWLGITL